MCTLEKKKLVMVDHVQIATIVSKNVKRKTHLTIYQVFLQVICCCAPRMRRSANYLCGYHRNSIVVRHIEANNYRYRSSQPSIDTGLSQQEYFV